MVYGYLRVSTDKQDEGRQEELKVYEIDHYFLDKISGESATERPENVMYLYDSMQWFF